MLTESERYSSDQKTKMFRTLTLLANKTYASQQLRQKLLVSLGNQTVALSKCASDNPQNLPALPVPSLQDTTAKYLKSVQPLLTEAEFKTTECKFKNFADGVGKKLQEYLIQKSKCTTNWFEPWWLEVAYLGFRQPVVVYSSPGQVFPLQTFKNECDRLNYTVKLVLAAASYKMLIDSKKMPMEKMGKDELDMNQYNKIFGTCRIPNLPSDCLEFNPHSKHIIVARNNHFFKVNLFNESGKPLSEKQLSRQLNKIAVDSAQPAAAPIGILTSDNRDNWAKAYNCLMKDSCNAASVREIQTSLFLVCLDCPIDNKSCDNRLTLAVKQFIHGDGSNYNSGNRWYDKTVQFILGTDGVVGLTYEHSPAEGSPIAVMVDYLQNFIKKDGSNSIPDSDHDCDPTLLPFRMNSELEGPICTAKTNIDKLVKNFEMQCFSFDKYGKEFIKKQKMSPDSYIQMALQFTYYRMYNKPAAHYESAATRKYLGGRTETIRSCSVESVAFAKAMLDCKVDNSQKEKTLRAAVDAHKKYTADAVNGYGVDRHLLGLKLSAKELGMELPDIYKDPSFIRSTHFSIASSQVATKCDGLMGYGATEHDGYGCCYNPRDNNINFAISAYKDNESTSAEKFKQTLICCLTDMETILSSQKKAKL